MQEADDILAHYGVKGMRWGVITKKVGAAYTKARTEDTTPVGVTVKAPPGKQIKTSGGKYQDTSDDAIRAATAKQKAKTSGLQSLSNKEMQDLVSRMNLEQQYNRLNAPPQSLGQKFIQGLFSSPAPDLALAGAQWKFGDSKDPRVQIGLQVAPSLIKSVRDTGKKKKK